MSARCNPFNINTWLSHAGSPFCLHAAWLLIEIKHAGYSRLIPHQCKGCRPALSPVLSRHAAPAQHGCAAAMLVVPSAFGQPLRATVVHIEGVQDTWRVTDKDGKIVEVHVPAQSLDQHPDESGGAPGCQRHLEQVRGTVPATVVAVDTLTNRVKVQTQAGQVIELDTATTDRQIGEQVTLILPPHGAETRDQCLHGARGCGVPEAAGSSLMCPAHGVRVLEQVEASSLIGARGVTPRVFQWHAAVMVKPDLITGCQRGHRGESSVGAARTPEVFTQNGREMSHRC